MQEKNRRDDAETFCAFFIFCVFENLFRFSTLVKSLESHIDKREDIQCKHMFWTHSKREKKPKLQKVASEAAKAFGPPSGRHG